MRRVTDVDIAVARERDHRSDIQIGDAEFRADEPVPVLKLLVQHQQRRAGAVCGGFCSRGVGHHADFHKHGGKQIGFDFGCRP